MITTLSVKRLTVDDILKTVTEYDIFKYFIGDTFKIGTRMKSPLRVDNTPSFCIFRTSYGLYELRFIDYSMGISGSCFDYVMKLYACNFSESVNIIASAFNLKPSLGNATKTITEHIRSERSYSNIEVSVRNWNSSSDKEYWTQFSISCPTLIKYRVYPLKAYKINDIFFHANTTTYGYYFGNGKWKIYNPKQEYKWLSNASASIIQGYDQLPNDGDLLVITKSLKDVMLLHELGIPAIAPQNEAVLVPEWILKKLMVRFTTIVVNYDFDYIGVHSGNMYKRLYNFPIYYLTNGRLGTYNYGAKDITDFAKIYGIDELKLLISKIKLKSEKQ